MEDKVMAGFMPIVNLDMQLKTTYYIIPEADYIRDNGNRKKYLFAFVADDAFTLKTTMIKPYPGINLDKAKVIYN